MQISSWIAPALLLSAAAAAQQAVTAPAGYELLDAPSLLWLPGCPAALRQQTVIDARHLDAAAGSSLTALLWRREADATPFAGGRVNLVIRVGASASDALRASPSFAVNDAGSAIVYSGLFVIPSAPAAPGPAASWSVGNVVRIPFNAPFPYVLGTNLLVDVVGTPDQQQPVDWWPADAAREFLTGQMLDVGSGCGVYGGTTGRWASVVAGTLLPGGTGQFLAWGTSGGLGISFLGSQAIADQYPLSSLLPGAMANCRVHLAGLLSSSVTIFDAPLDPSLTSLGGLGTFRLQIPSQPWALGATFAVQWMDVQQQFALSNAVRWSVASGMPTLGMAVVQGEATAASGEVLPATAHVIRFEIQ